MFDEIDIQKPIETIEPPHKENDIQQFEIGLQTAKSESGPLVLIEYLAQSLPFLTFNTGQVVDDIKSDIPQLILDNFELNHNLHFLNLKVI